MRVLMLASYFPKPQNPVMGNWALSQAQALLRAGVEVTVVSGTSWVPHAFALSAGARAYAECPEVHHWDRLMVWYPRWFLYSVGPFRALSRANPGLQLEIGWRSARTNLLGIIKQYRPQLIYAHHTQVNGFMAYRLKKSTGLPYVVTDHDFAELEDCRTYPRRYRFFEKIVMNSSRMIAVAARMELILKDLFPHASTLTIHNGTDMPPPEVFITPRPPDLGSRRIIFCACALYERKGVPLLVKAFSQIAPRYPDAELRIAGDGPQRSEVEAAVREAGLESRVRLLGKVLHGKVLQEMVWCDLFALPGWDEPFATAFSEALSVGRPVIYSIDGGIGDVVRNGVEGLAVIPKDLQSLVAALDCLLNDDDRRRAMGIAARRLYESRLRWEQNAARMKDVFDEAISEVA